MRFEDFSPERQAQIYALVFWNDKSIDGAVKIANNTTFEELDKNVYSADSINKAKKGIMDNIAALESDNKFDAIIKICAEIHDKWVETNAKKYNRGTPEKTSAKLYQHLPTALIGLDEIALDLMFLAPFLQKMGINAGTFEQTSSGNYKFISSKEVSDAYNRYSNKFLYKNNIYDSKTLKAKLPDIINSYSALKPIDKIGEDRIEFLNNNITALYNSVKDKIKF